MRGRRAQGRGGLKKKGSGTGSRGLALSYPGLPAPLDVNRSVSASSLDVDSAGAQKQRQLRGCAARLQDLVRAPGGGRRLLGRGPTGRLGDDTLQDRRTRGNEGGGHAALRVFQPAVNSLGANGGTVGRRSALAARLTQPRTSLGDGRCGVDGCDRRSSDEAPPRQDGAARRAWRGPAAGRRRGVSGIQRHPVFGAPCRRQKAQVPGQAQLPCQRKQPSPGGIAARRGTNCVDRPQRPYRTLTKT